ncbi:hypothetical protein VNI00_012655 [Paramarasmius palmivorus]|uniref:G protein-coupled receptor n=1 Tax=Paramarasmius palmivorus TaxID=297713 RepID=A0AAW0C394_9AGAR
MDRQGVVIGFFVALLITVGSTTLIPFAGEAYQIGPANPFCTARMNPALAQVMLLVPLPNQLAIFFAISWRLLPRHILEESSSERTFPSKLKVVFRGKHLPALSKTLFIDGQRYILVFIVTTIITAVTMSIKELPDIYRFILVAPHIAIENSMNSYLFRSVRAALTTNVVTESTIHFRQTESEHTNVRRSIITQSVIDA